MHSPLVVFRTLSTTLWGVGVKCAFTPLLWKYSTGEMWTGRGLFRKQIAQTFPLDSLGCANPFVLI